MSAQAAATPCRTRLPDTSLLAVSSEAAGRRYNRVRRTIPWRRGIKRFALSSYPSMQTTCAPQHSRSCYGIETHEPATRRRTGVPERGFAASGAKVTRDHQDSFRATLISHLPKLRRYAIALAGNVSAADDLVQDCAERALKRAGSLGDQKRMAGWLRSILHNLYIDQVRLQKSRGGGIDLTLLENDLSLSAPATDGGATIDFMRSFNGLSVEHRQILLLVGVEGLSYGEVAGELAIPIGTVMSRLARARERLRNALEKEQTSAPVKQHPTGQRLER
jgi:RNA polymerase sigma-70 factor (ECF subfamily)